MPGSRQEFYERIAHDNLTPLWNVLGALVPAAPRSQLAPAVWKYSTVVKHVLEATRLISAEEAERRVLILENPALRGASAITHTLYAGLQAILPGEVARSHRHTQSALRIVLDGEGAYTTVDGERRTMKRGDLILTPHWTWHDHGNLGDVPVIWLDGLDIPLVRMLDASFAEHGVETSQRAVRPEGDSLARYGRNLVPVDYYPSATDAARAFAYPYDNTLAALRGIAWSEPDAHLGFKLRFVNAATGGAPMPTMSVFAQLVPAGMETRPYRSTDSTIYVCLEGEGEAAIEGQLFPLSVNDVFVAPSWNSLRLRARSDLVLFSYSDRVLQQAVGLWREERLQ